MTAAPPAPSSPASPPIEVAFPDLARSAAGNSGIGYVWTFAPSRPGPHLLLQALTHGNEVCGAIALDRLLRSSPLYQLGPQTPPTLLLQGEFDGHGTTDAERVYIRLNRQNVPVQLARYWGEGHNFMMAASIRDRVHRAIAWYGDHLGVKPGH